MSEEETGKNEGLIPELLGLRQAAPKPGWRMKKPVGSSAQNKSFLQANLPSQVDPSEVTKKVNATETRNYSEPRGPLVGVVFRTHHWPLKALPSSSPRTTTSKVHRARLRIATLKTTIPRVPRVPSLLNDTAQVSGYGAIPPPGGLKRRLYDYKTRAEGYLL